MNASVDIMSNTSTFNTSAINMSEFLANEPDWFVELTNNFRKFYFNMQMSSSTSVESTETTASNDANTSVELVQPSYQYDNNYNEQSEYEQQPYRQLSTNAEENAFKPPVDAYQPYDAPQVDSYQQDNNQYVNYQTQDQVNYISAAVEDKLPTSMPSTPLVFQQPQFQFNPYQNQNQVITQPSTILVTHLIHLSVFKANDSAVQSQPVPMYSYGQNVNTTTPFNPQPSQSPVSKERTPSTSSSVGKIRRKRNSDSFSDYHNSSMTNKKEDKPNLKSNVKSEPVDQDDGKFKNGLSLDQQKNNKGLLSSVFGIFSRQQSGPKAMVLPPDKEKKVICIYRKLFPRITIDWF
jgi:hypothetical protein